jgi:hypothetical protein
MKDKKIVTSLSAGCIAGLLLCGCVRSGGLVKPDPEVKEGPAPAGDSSKGTPATTPAKTSP